jgi:hypothetical protein
MALTPPAALFSSTHQALRFAYTFSSTQHGTAAAAERRIALAAKERYPSPPGSGRNLRGLDGAAQAGLIRSMVERTTDAKFQLLVAARHALLDEAARKAACSALAVLAQRGQPPEVSLMISERLVASLTGRAVNLVRMAGEQEVAPSTVYRWRQRVARHLRAIDAANMPALTDALQTAGVVE